MMRFFMKKAGVLPAFFIARKNKNTLSLHKAFKSPESTVFETELKGIVIITNTLVHFS